MDNISIYYIDMDPYIIWIIYYIYYISSREKIAFYSKNFAYPATKQTACENIPSFLFLMAIMCNRYTNME